MNSIFSSPPRPRAISNGGLGGFIPVEKTIATWGVEPDETATATWPRRRKKRPPPISLVCNSTEYLPGGMRSPDYLLDSVHARMQHTPKALGRTESSTDNLTVPLGSPSGPVPATTAMGSPRSPRMAEMSKFLRRNCLVSPFRARVSQESGVYNTLPEISSAPNQHFPSDTPVELPGSLLLAGQGFPLSILPPATPPRQQSISSSISALSRLSELNSPPGLSTSSSSTSFGEDLEMFKAVNHPKRGIANAISVKAGTASSLASTTAATPTVGKPMSAMTIEELLTCLPTCGQDVITWAWIPAMREEYRRIIAMIQDQAKIKSSEETVDFKSFSKDLHAISVDAQLISNTYERVAGSIDYLIERDNKNIFSRMEEAETKLQQAQAIINENNQTMMKNEEVIRDKDELISELHYSGDYNVLTLASFIQSILPEDYDSLDEQKLQEVMEIVTNHTPASGSSSPITRRLWVSEEKYTATLAALQDARNKSKETQFNLDRHREFTRDLGGYMKVQSQRHDHSLSELSKKCAEKIEMRDEKIKTLLKVNEDLICMMDGFQKGLDLKSVAEVVQNSRYEQCDAESSTVKDLLARHESELEDKDAEIAVLRQKLGSAKEEILARQADVKNVITQTQALLSASKGPDHANLGLTAKDHKANAKVKRKQILPNSRSLLSFGLSDSKSEQRAHSDNGSMQYSTKEAVVWDNKTRETLEPRVEHPIWGFCGPKSGSSENQDVLDPLNQSCSHSITSMCQENPSNCSLLDFAPRARVNSLDALAGTARMPPYDRHAIASAVTKELLASPLNVEKALPSPPLVASDSSSQSSDPFYEPSESHRFQPKTDASTTNFHGNPGVHKRVLSNIREASVEDLSTDKTVPAAVRSDFEAYRKEMRRLNLIEVLRESDMRTPQCTSINDREAPEQDYEEKALHDGEGIEEDEAIETGVATVVSLKQTPAKSEGSNSGANTIKDCQ